MGARHELFLKGGGTSHHAGLRAFSRLLPIPATLAGAGSQAAGALCLTPWGCHLSNSLHEMCGLSPAEGAAEMSAMGRMMRGRACA